MLHGFSKYRQLHVTGWQSLKVLRLALVVILVVAVTVQTNFSAYKGEVESDAEVNLSEAGPSSQVVSLLDRLKSLTSLTSLTRTMLSVIMLQFNKHCWNTY